MRQQTFFGEVQFNEHQRNIGHEPGLIQIVGGEQARQLVTDVR